MLLFNLIDFFKVFHQIPLAVSNIPKTAMTTPFDSFEFTAIIFGVPNTAQTFSRFMDSTVTFGLLIGRIKFEQRIFSHLRLVFEHLKKFLMAIILAECVFGAKKLEHLQHGSNAKAFSLPHYPRYNQHV